VAALDRTERDYDNGDLTGKQYSARQGRLEGELDAANNAAEVARQRVEKIESAGTLDGESVLLRRLAALKAAVGDKAEKAPDLNAVRLLLRDMFESFALCTVHPWPVREDGTFDYPSATDADAGEPYDDPTLDAPFNTESRNYMIWPKLRVEALDEGFQVRKPTLPLEAESPVDTADTGVTYAAEGLPS
jgi:hypothetical protein